MPGGPVSKDCVFDPSQTDCHTFKLSDAKILSALNENCRQYPESLACSLFQYSNGRRDVPEFPLFQHLVNTCEDPLHADISCKTYIVLCRPTSVISECGISPNLPSSNEFVQLCERFPSECRNCDWQPKVRNPTRSFALYDTVREEEDDHGTGDGDDRREEPCNSALVSARICAKHIHENIPQCAAWTTLCQSINYTDLNLCPDLGPPMPVYKPYLHLSGPEFIVFQEWVTNTYVSSLLALVMSIFLGLMYEILVGTRKRWQAVWALEDRQSDRGDGTGELENTEEESQIDPLLPPRRSLRNNMTFQRIILIRGRMLAVSVRRRAIRSVLRLFEVTCVAAMLLVASTFNIVYIVSISVGLTIGNFFAGTSDIELFELSNDL
ncbi:MAG: hypothetical protein SGCHY_000945 [Lobulomycetales sp.]